MEECSTEDIDSVWPIFCGTVILPYIFTTIWWTHVILWILVLIWAIDLYFMIKWFWIICLFLPVVVCWSLIWKYFVNVARLEIGQLFTQGTRRGHPSTVDTFLVLKLAANDRSDRMFVLTSKLRPQGVVSPCLGATYMNDIMKKIV